MISGLSLSHYVGCFLCNGFARESIRTWVEEAEARARPLAAHRRKRPSVLVLDFEEAPQDKSHTIMSSITKLLNSCSCKKTTDVVPLRSKRQPTENDLEDDDLSISDHDGGVSLSGASSISWSGSEYELDCVTARVPVTMPMILPGAVASITDLLEYENSQVNYVKRYHSRHRNLPPVSNRRPAKKLGELPPLEIQGYQKHSVLPPIKIAEYAPKADQACDKAKEKRHQKRSQSAKKRSASSAQRRSNKIAPAPVYAKASKPAKRQKAAARSPKQGTAHSSMTPAQSYNPIAEVNHSGFALNSFLLLDSTYRFQDQLYRTPFFTLVKELLLMDRYVRTIIIYNMLQYTKN